jgi:hypothetical protein
MNQANRLLMTCPECDALISLVIDIMVIEGKHGNKPVQVRTMAGVQLDDPTKRLQCCSPCHTHTQQTLREVEQGKFKWVCNVCGHATKKFAKPS